MGEGVRLHPSLEAMDEGRPYRRIEVITGRRQRRSYTAEEKARIVAESAAPGVNISEVARRNGVNRGLLTVWRREAGVVAEAIPVQTPLFDRKRCERTFLSGRGFSAWICNGAP